MIAQMWEQGVALVNAGPHLDDFDRCLPET